MYNRSMNGKKLGSKPLHTREEELAICDYYWTRQTTGFYPSYKEVSVAFNCSPGHVRNLLKKHNYPRRTNAETRESRPCKPVNQPCGPAPLCACGCGQSVQWISKDSKWLRYAEGHYGGMERKRVQPRYNSIGFNSSTRPSALYTSAVEIDKERLTQLYAIEKHTVNEVADILVVGPRTVRVALRHHGIPIRTTKESLILRGSSVGANNPAWKGGVAKWDYAPDWKRLCKQIKDRDKWSCQLCGLCRSHWGHRLHVHHIDEDKMNNHPHNLISLCWKCHAPIHGKEEKRAMLVEIAMRNTSG